MLICNVAAYYMHLFPLEALIRVCTNLVFAFQVYVDWNYLVCMLTFFEKDKWKSIEKYGLCFVFY